MLICDTMLAAARACGDPKMIALWERRCAEQQAFEAQLAGQIASTNAMFNALDRAMFGGEK